MDEIIKKLEQLAIVDVNKSFRQITTLRIGGKIKYLIYPKNIVALGQVINILNENQIPFKMLGKGSNILCSDDDYDGAIIKLDRFISNCYVEGEYLIAEAGCSIIAASNLAMRHSLKNLEFASGIPGTVGGCVFMNAGAYTHSMSEIITEVFVFIDGECKWMKNAELDFAYRHSIFQSHPDWIILAVKLKLAKGDPEEIFALLTKRRERRLATQPLNFPSAGSTFRNSTNHSAWELIDGINFRGHQVGGAMVSEKHANFLINYNHASYQDFISLASQVQQKVKEKYQIDLIMEVEKFNCK